jgi:hypothetical protein
MRFRKFHTRALVLPTRPVEVFQAFGTARCFLPVSTTCAQRAARRDSEENAGIEPHDDPCGNRFT